MKYEIRFTNQFKKDLKSAQKQGKDLNLLFGIIEILANGDVLLPKYHDHMLVGNYTGCHECHIESDWLLIYEYNNDYLILILNRVGSHSDLFR